jgi:hypothetical protein
MDPALGLRRFAGDFGDGGFEPLTCRRRLACLLDLLPGLDEPQGLAAGSQELRCGFAHRIDEVAARLRSEVLLVEVAGTELPAPRVAAAVGDAGGRVAGRPEILCSPCGPLARSFQPPRSTLSSPRALRGQREGHPGGSYAPL